jgi:fructosamine-3-kinase
MPTTFTKRFRHPDLARLEALSLAWLAEAHDGVRVVRVLRQREQLLDLEYLSPAVPAAIAPERFGRALAHTHAAGAPHFGAPPPTWQGPGMIGLAPMSYTDTAGLEWGQFYAQERLLPYAAAAAKKGRLAASDLKAICDLAERLQTGLFDSPQPGLVQPHQASRLHGDLWTGNVMWTEPPLSHEHVWTGAALIDPSAHGGHAETDLAMLALFGLTGLDRVVAAYNEVSALADGWRERVGLHQIYPLLVHAMLFGGSYGARAGQRARDCL